MSVRNLSLENKEKVDRLGSTEETKINKETVACFSVSVGSFEYTEYHKPENIGRTTKRKFDIEKLSKDKAEKKDYKPCEYCFKE